MKHHHLTISGRKITAYKMVFQRNGKQMETGTHTDLTILRELKAIAEKSGYKYIKTITI